MRYYLSLFLLLGACAAPAPNASTASLQQKVLIAETAYEAPLAVAIAYNKRPRCPKAVICSEQNVVDQLRKVNRTVQATFAEAMQYASIPGIAESKVTAALAVAYNGMASLQSIIDAYNGGK